MSWQQTVDNGQELVLATSSKSGIPNAIVVISLGLVDKKILIGACQMKTTLENMASNNHVIVVSKKNGEYYRIRGVAEIYTSGKYFDLASIKSKPYTATGAITIDVKEVFDLDKQQVILH